MKRALLCLTLAACGTHFDFPDFRLATTPGADAYPGVNALILQAADTVEFKKDGSATFTRYRRFKVYSADGARAAEVHLPFSAKYRLNFFAGRVITPVAGGVDRVEDVSTGEGRIIRPLDGEGSREIGEVVLGFPHVGPGVAFDYVAVYRVPDATLIEPIVMRQNFPVAHSEVTVIAPQDFDLDLRILEDGQSSATAPTKPSDAPSGAQAYRFVKLDLPPLINEELAPAAVKSGPVVWPVVRKGSSIRMQRWEDVRTWLDQTFKLPAGAGSKSEEEPLRNEFQKLALTMPIKESALKLGERAKRVGNDRIEVGLRLYLAMRSEGWGVQPVLVAREESSIVLSEVPSPATFDAVLLSYESEGKTQYLDPSCPSCLREQVSPALEGAPAVSFGNGGAKVETLPGRQATDNAFVFTLSGTLSTHADLTGNGTAVLSGSPAANGRGAYLQNNANTLSDALGWSKDVKVLQPKAPDGPAGQTFELSFDFAGHCADEGNARLRCTPQHFLQEVLHDVWREARTRDLILPNAFSQQLIVTLRIPTGKVDVPQPVALKTKYGEYQLGYKLDGATLTMSRRLALTQRRVPSEDYEAFFKFLTDVRRSDTVGPAIDLFAEGEAPPPAVEPAKKGKPAKKGRK